MRKLDLIFFKSHLSNGIFKKIQYSDRSFLSTKFASPRLVPILCALLDRARHTEEYIAAKNQLPARTQEYERLSSLAMT